MPSGRGRRTGRCRVCPRKEDHTSASQTGARAQKGRAQWRGAVQGTSTKGPDIGDADADRAGLGPRDPATACASVGAHVDRALGACEARALGVLSVLNIPYAKGEKYLFCE